MSVMTFMINGDGECGMGAGAERGKKVRGDKFKNKEL